MPLSEVVGRAQVSWSIDAVLGTVKYEIAMGAGGYLYQNTSIPTHPANAGILLSGTYPNQLSGGAGYLKIYNYDAPTLAISSLPAAVSISGGPVTQVSGGVINKYTCGWGTNCGYATAGGVAPPYGSSGYGSGSYALEAPGCTQSGGGASSSYTAAPYYQNPRSGAMQLTFVGAPLTPGSSPGYWVLVPWTIGYQENQTTSEYLPRYRSTTLLGTYTPNDPNALPASYTVTA